jgi:RNA polymerase sigma factor (sigma-70 family)
MTKNTLSDIELLKASLRGQTPAFEVIVRKYQSLICAITYSATGSAERSEELAQQAFVKCWKNLGQLKDLSKFRAWLCSITRHVINDSYRRQKNDITSKAIPMDSIRDHPSEDTGPVDAAISKEREAIVNEALSKIPETFREPLVLYYREDRSYRQVADQLGFSEHTARERISRARSLLKEKVASLVEETIERTKPSKVFTTAVIASIAGIAIKGSGVAAAAGIGAATSTAGTPTGLAAIMSGVTAKIITAAVVVVIGVGAVVTYKHVTKPSPGPELSQAGIIVQKQGEEQDNVKEEVTAQFSKEKTDPPDGRSTNGIVQNKNQTKQEMNGTQDNKPETLANNNIQVLSDSPYDYFLFTLLSRSENTTKTLVLVELTDEGFKSQNIDTNRYASYRWEGSLCVTDGILYGARNGSLLSMNLAAPGNDGFKAIGFGLRPTYNYLDGRLYGKVRIDEDTTIYRTLDFKTKAYRDVIPLEGKLNYPSATREPLAVSPDHKRLAFFTQDPNGILVTAMDMDSGRILQANKPIKLKMPMIASTFYLPPLVWLDNEKILTIRTEQIEKDTNNIKGSVVNKLTFLDITTGEIEDILPLPGNAMVGFAPYLSQDYLEPGPRVIMRQRNLGEYRLDVAAGKLVEDDMVKGDYFIIDGYLFHDENDLGPVKRKDLKVSPDGKRAMWISDKKLLFHDIASTNIHVVCEKEEAEEVLLWFTKEDMRASGEIKRPPEGWIAFNDYSQPKRQESPPCEPRQPALSKFLTFTMETDKAEYLLHEPIEISIVLTNTSEVDVDVYQPAVFGLGGYSWDGLSLNYPGGSSLIDHGAQPYESKLQEILLKPGESISATDTLEVAMVGDYQAKCKYEGPRSNNYRGGLSAGPIAFSVNPVEDAEKEKQLFVAKFARLMERFYREHEMRPGWNGANDTVGDKLVGIPGMGSRAADYLIEVINSEEHKTARQLLFRALAKVADDQTLPFFRQSLNSGESEQVCRWIYDLYRKKRDANEVADEPLTALLSGMKYEDAEVRRDTIDQLVRIYDPCVVSCLKTAVEDADEEVRDTAARYLAATEWLDLAEWFALAKEQPTYTRYMAARSIIKELERKWNITKGLLPEISAENFADNNEKLKRFSEIVDEWQKWASENSRFSFYFFDNDRKDWF